MGILGGTYVWRPPSWWLVALAVFVGAASYLAQRRPRIARALSFGTLTLLGAFIVEVHGPAATQSYDIIQFADGGEVVVIAHVTRDGFLRELLPGFIGNTQTLWRNQIRRSVLNKIHLLWSPEKAALIDAMVIGEESFLDRDTRVNFQRSGTYHVLVVSGMNLGILAFVVFWLLRKLRVSDVIASVITVLLGLGYAYLCNWDRQLCVQHSCSLFILGRGCCIATAAL